MQLSAPISTKMPAVQTTIFTKMSALAAQHNALNLSQGFPDFPASRKLISLVNKYMLQDKNQYAPMAGVPELRKIISQKIEKLYGTTYDADREITITAGGTQALSAAISSLIKEGDEVIIFTPAYDSYGPVVQLNGGNPVYIKLRFPDYTVNWDEVKTMLSHRTRMIIINSPHNPTGAMLTPDDLDQLAHITNNSDMIILSDEVYEHITFDGQKHHSVCGHPQLAERSIAVFSLGKTCHVTGWKIGYAVAPAELMVEFRKVHQYEVFCVNGPMQYALAEFLMDEENYQIADFYQQKRDLFRAQIAGSRFTLLPCAGSYFQLVDYSQISEEKDTDFAERLVVEFGIAAIPVSVFYNAPEHNQVLRFCFAKQDDTLRKAGEILRSI